MSESLRFPFLDLKTVNERYADAMTRAAKNVVDSGRYIGGEYVERFNHSLAGMCNAPIAVGVSNGLDALFLILRAWIEIGLLAEGDEIIVPSNTYIASVLAITHAGLRPRLVDPDISTMNLSAHGIEKAITPRTRALMLVHLYGRIAWDDRICSIAKSHNLLVIEDAAQAIGATAPTPGLFNSHKAGALGHAGAFSFYPTKNIGALGDAGAVVTHSKQLAETVSALANYGSARRYHNLYRGFNCRLDPLQAAILLEKLPDTNHANARRFERAVAYNNVITHPLVVKPLFSNAVTDCVWHQYVIRVLGGQRNRMKQYLEDNGVGTDIHYPVPPHLQPCYSQLELHSPLPVAETLADEVLSLPISDCTSVADAAEIGHIINRFV